MSKLEIELVWEEMKTECTLYDDFHQKEKEVPKIPGRFHWKSGREIKESR